jgi:two-component system, NtrC family, sensor kinase
MHVSGIHLLNPEGYWLHSPDPADAWGFMFDRDLTMHNRFPDSWRKINSSSKGQFRNGDGIFTFTTISPLRGGLAHSATDTLGSAGSPGDERRWKLLALIDRKTLTAMNLAHLRWWGQATVIALLILLPVAYWIARSRHQQAMAMHGLEVIQRRLSLQIESSHDAIFTCSEQGSIHALNQAAEGMFGIARDRAIGSPIVNHISHPDIPGDELLFRVVGESILHRDLEVTATREDGSEFPAGVTAGYTMEDGEPLFSVYIRDLTRRNQAEEERHVLERQLNESNKMEAIGRLAGGIAHEINTPMQYISDNLRFIEESYKDFDQAMQLYNSLAEQVSQDDLDHPTLLDLADQVEKQVENIDLDFIREEIPTAIRQSLDGADLIVKLVLSMKQFAHPGSDGFEPTNLNEAISSTLTVCRNEWKYHADVSMELDAFLPLVPCLASPLRQVMLNLIVNAAHAIEEKGEEAKGKIVVSTAIVGEMAEIRVTDSGKGIPEEVRDRIFDPFFTTKQVGKGSGQGLAIVYDIIVRKHAGKLFFKTEIDEGTTFILQIPHSPVIEDSPAANSEKPELVG